MKNPLASVMALATALVLSVVALVLAGPAASDRDHGGIGLYEFEFSIEPGQPDRPEVRCDATIRDLRSGEVLYSPRLHSAWGEEAEVTWGSADHTRDSTVAVLVDAAGKTAVVTAVVRKNGEIVASHKGTVALRADRRDGRLTSM